MSAISSLGSNAALYQTAAPATPKAPAAAVPAAPVASSDPDHDGDKDGAGVNVHG